MPVNDVLAMEAEAQGVGNFSGGDGRRDVTRTALGGVRQQMEAPQSTVSVQMDPQRVIMWGIVVADLLLLYIAWQV